MMLKVLRWESRYRRLSRRERGAADGRARGAPLLYFTIQPVGTHIILLFCKHIAVLYFFSICVVMIYLQGIAKNVLIELIIK